MYNGQGLSNDFHWFDAADDKINFKDKRQKRYQRIWGRVRATKKARTEGHLHMK